MSEELIKRLQNLADGCFPHGTVKPILLEAISALTAQQSQEPVACEWRLSDEFEGDTWDGQCGAKWTFTEAGPDENDMHYCPSCGGKLTIRAAQEGK
jgi:hypothetical protein